MKIFNIEHGVEKVYVQINDLLTLYKTEQYIPISIFDKVFSSGLVIDEENKYDFIGFYDPDEINFFKAIDWIVDGKKLNKKSIDELKNTYMESITDIKSFLEDHRSCILDEDENYEYELLVHRSNSIRDFFRAKYGNLRINFPEVANSEGLIIDDSAKSGMYISESLNPNSIVMSKTSGEQFTGKEPINNQLINRALEKMRVKRKDTENELFKYKTSYDMSSDLKSFVIRYREGKCKTEKEEQRVLNKSNKVKRLLKKILKKRDD